MATSRLCSIPSCDKRAIARSWCHTHYKRWQKHGDPLGGGQTRGYALRYFLEIVLTYEGNECLIWPYARNSQGYGQLRRDGQSNLVPRLACEEQNGPPPTPEHETAHSCGKGSDGCCTKRHLSWKTHTGNMADKIEHGTTNRGERSGMAKLTETQVRQIRSLKGVLLNREIGSRFGVDQSTIGKILSGREWAWLDRDAPLEDSPDHP